MSNGKYTIIYLIVGLLKMSQYFSKLYEPFGRDINVKVDLSKYATKADLKNSAVVDTSSFVKKTDLASLECNVEKLDIDELDIDLSKLSNAAKNDVVKKDVYNAKIKNNEDKMPDITNLATNITINAKINEFNGELPSIINIPTTIALTTVENKIPNVSNLVQKSDYNTKINEIEKNITDHNHDKYITTPEFNKLTAGNFGARLAQTNLVTKTDLIIN